MQKEGGSEGTIIHYYVFFSYVSGAEFYFLANKSLIVLFVKSG